MALSTNQNTDTITPSTGSLTISGAIGSTGGYYCDNYDYTTPATGFSYTIPNNIQVAIIAPSGTLATGTITMPSAPNHGQQVMA